MDKLSSKRASIWRLWGAPAHFIMVLWVCYFAGCIALAQEPAHPLKPPERSSPRAALKTFLEAGDALGTLAARDYLPSPSRAEFRQLLSLVETTLQCLDLSEVPPAARGKTGRAAAVALYETLCRIQLPPFDEIPDAGRWSQTAGTNTTRWVIPNTEIALERVQSGPRQGEFLFSPETAANAEKFCQRVSGLPYARPVPLENLKEIMIIGGGWLVPYRWIQALPAWLRNPMAGQAAWKWLGLALVLSGFALLLRVAYRLSRRVSNQHPFLQALAEAGLPAFLLLATPAIAYLARVQINFIGNVGSGIEMAATAVKFLAGAWITWRVAPVIAEAIIASPRIAPESIDAHLIRIFTRVLGIIGGAGLLAVGAERLGMPLYGVIAGLGVGGVAIALAAQPTIENLIGGLSLFADKAIRVGTFCKYGEDTGTVEAIGIRSTRIRGIDRTLTTIPNAELSKMPVVNFAERDRMLIKCVIGVRHETGPEQLRYLLVRIREMLLGHPRIHPDPARARFIGYGASSLDIEVFAYVATRDWTEFLGVREDVLLRIMDIMKESGTSFALPSQTLYFARANELDANSTNAAEAQVRHWREEGRLPFPDFSPEQKKQIRGSLVYPPVGSSQPAPKNNSDLHPTAAGVCHRPEVAIQRTTEPGTKETKE